MEFILKLHAVRINVKTQLLFQNIHDKCKCQKYLLI